jgi:predicted transglutaminase-like cysteine proteinase
MNSVAKHQLGFFALASLLFVLMPNSISIRDDGSATARRLVVDVPWHQHLLASAFGTIDRAIFTLPRPVGTTIPDFADYRLVNPDAPDLAIVASAPSKRSERNHLEFALPQKIAPPIVKRLAEIDPEAPRPNPQPNGRPERQIQSGPAIIEVSIPSLAPMAYTRFCLEYSEDCDRRGMNFRRRTIALTAERWAELTTVNRQINQDIIPERDEGDVLTEEWRLHPVAGACHDYAVTKRHELLAQGWPSSSLLLSEVVMSSGEHHLVLVVRTNEGDVVLDNLNANIQPVEMVPYQWIRIQSTSNPNFWFTVGPRKAA